MTLSCFKVYSGDNGWQRLVLRLRLGGALQLLYPSFLYLHQLEFSYLLTFTSLWEHPFSSSWAPYLWWVSYLLFWVAKKFFWWERPISAFYLGRTQLEETWSKVVLSMPLLSLQSSFLGRRIKCDTSFFGVRSNVWRYHNELYSCLFCFLIFLWEVLCKTRRNQEFKNLGSPDRRNGQWSLHQGVRLTLLKYFDLIF